MVQTLRFEPLQCWLRMLRQNLTTSTMSMTLGIPLTNANEARVTAVNHRLRKRASKSLKIYLFDKKMHTSTL